MLLNYIMIASCSRPGPELSRPVEKKNELTQEMFKFVSPCDINLHGWEKHEVNYPVRLDTFYN